MYVFQKKVLRRNKLDRSSERKRETKKQKDEQTDKDR